MRKLSETGEEKSSQMEKQKRVSVHKPRVLMLPVPGQGHINPMIEFAKRLLYKGVKPTLVVTRSFHKSIHVAPDNPIHVETISDGDDDGGLDSAESPEVYFLRFRDVGSRALSELINRSCPIAGLIYDGHLPWALDVAKKFGVLGAAFFTQSCAVDSVYYHVQRGILPVPLSGPTVSLPGLPELQASDTSSFVSDYGSYPFFFDLVVGQFDNIDDADWVLVNSFYDLETETVDWMRKQWRTATIGPAVPSMYLDKRLVGDKDYGFNLFKPETSSCMNWLRNKPSGSVVYVSFGSLAELGKEQMEELAWGLKQSNCYFLWVIRGSEEAKLPPNLIDEAPDKGMIVNWCPQLDVLAHESMGCFVTHCGFNSVLEAISLGVPIVAMPQWTDQPTNAKFVEDVWKVGIRAKRDETGLVRREVVEACVKEVIKGEKGKELKENVKRLRDLAKKTVDVGGSSDRCIDEFVADLIFRM